MKTKQEILIEVIDRVSILDFSEPFNNMSLNCAARSGWFIAIAKVLKTLQIMRGEDEKV